MGELGRSFSWSCRQNKFRDREKSQKATVVICVRAEGTLPGDCGWTCVSYLKHGKIWGRTERIMGRMGEVKISPPSVWLSR